MTKSMKTRNRTQRQEEQTGESSRRTADGNATRPQGYPRCTAFNPQEPRYGPQLCGRGSTGDSQGCASSNAQAHGSYIDVVRRRHGANPRLSEPEGMITS